MGLRPFGHYGKHLTLPRQRWSSFDHGCRMSELAITVNGEPRRVPAPASVADLLHHLQLDPRMVVVELNRRIIRRPQLAATELAEGDTVELVHFVGGG